MLSENWDLISVNRVAWKRLIDQGRLKLLYVHDTGDQRSYGHLANKFDEKNFAGLVVAVRSGIEKCSIFFFI